MSNHLAIATVTATLQAVVQTAATASGVGSPRVTHLRPDAPGGLPAPGVNIYLYRVSPNPHWRNADLPTRRGKTMLRKPQIGLDLHYLLSFFGDDAELEPQRLLGAVTAALHADPPLPRSIMLDLANPASPSHIHYLAGSNLGDDHELVRITPTELNLEELSKLWSVFFQTQYVLSAAYTATVVLIETIPPEVALPAPLVEKAHVIVRAVPDPVIDEVTVVVLPPTLLVPDPRLAVRLRGKNLVFELPALNPPPGSVPSKARFRPPPGVADPLVVELLPSETNGVCEALIPATVRVGEQWVQVTNDAGDPKKALAASNVAAFTLRPSLRDVTILVGPPKQARVNVLPAIDASQPVKLLLFDELNRVRREVPVTTRETATRMLFDLTGVTAGTYELTLDVDGQLSDRSEPQAI